MPTDAECRADVARERADVRAARAVDLDIHVDEPVMLSDREHVEPVDADAASRQFDGLAFAGQLVGPLAVHLDGADRRRHLCDLAAKPGDGLTRSVRR